MELLLLSLLLLLLRGGLEVEQGSPYHYYQQSTPEPQNTSNSGFLGPLKVLVLLLLLFSSIFQVLRWIGRKSI